MPDALDSKPDRHPAPAPASLNATQIVANLAKVDGWRLDGDGAQVAIEKRFHFIDFPECLGFVNALGWTARRLGHSPQAVSIEAGSHVRVRWSTPAASGLSAQDFEAARQTDALSG